MIAFSVAFSFMLKKIIHYIPDQSVKEEYFPTAVEASSVINE